MSARAKSAAHARTHRAVQRRAAPRRALNARLPAVAESSLASPPRGAETLIASRIIQSTDSRDDV